MPALPLPRLPAHSDRIFFSAAFSSCSSTARRGFRLTCRGSQKRSGRVPTFKPPWVRGGRCTSRRRVFLIRSCKGSKRFRRHQSSGRCAPMSCARAARNCHRHTPWCKVTPPVLVQGLPSGIGARLPSGIGARLPLRYWCKPPPPVSVHSHRWHAPSSRHLRALLSVCGGCWLGVWGVVLVVCVCMCVCVVVGGAVLSVCVCV